MFRRVSAHRAHVPGRRTPEQTPSSDRTQSSLRAGEKIAYYLKKEFAPVFYAQGRVLCEPKHGGTFYALHQDMLADALDSEKTLIIITDSRWLEGLRGDPRFAIQFIASDGDALALRVELKRPD